jgi:hypothetical protein
MKNWEKMLAAYTTEKRYRELVKLEEKSKIFQKNGQNT